MNLRRQFLKWVYPIFKRISGQKAVVLNEGRVAAGQSFYSLSTTGIDGSVIPFSTFKDKHVLLVNTASDCGFTPQYAELETLFKKHKSKLVIIAFPSNDFKEQEKDANKDIATFCQRNYGVSFLIAEKTHVLKSKGQHPVYQWLTTSAANGWNDRQPDWNFGKYLIDPAGNLTGYWGPAVEPAMVAKLL